MLKKILIGTLHFTFATVGAGFIAAISFYFAKPVLSIFLSHATLDRDSLLVLPLFPYQAIVALVLGWQIRRKLRIEVYVGQLVAIFVTTLWFAIALRSWTTHQSLTNENVLRQLYAYALASPKRMQLLTIMPFITSISYSIGTLLAKPKPLKREIPTG